MPLANILSKIASCCLIFPFVALFFILLPYFSLCFILLPFFPYVSFCCLNLRHVCIMFASWVHYAASWVHYAASWVHYAASCCIMGPLCFTYLRHVSVMLPHVAMHCVMQYNVAKCSVKNACFEAI